MLFDNFAMAVCVGIGFLYDATGRMTGVTMAVGGTTTTVTYKYDASGFRVEATVDDGTNPPVTTVFHVDPNNPTGYIQVVEEGVDADGDGRLDAAEIEKAFVLGMDVLTQAAASLLGHLLYDAHGTTKSILDAATSSVVERYVYSAYGIDLGLASTPLTSLRYAGEYIDPISGLSFNRARWYNYSVGRFNQIDPWPGNIFTPLSVHRYLYANADPHGNIDPSGNTAFRVVIIVGFAIVGVLLAMSLGQPVRQSVRTTPGGTTLTPGLQTRMAQRAQVGAIATMKAAEQDLALASDAVLMRVADFFSLSGDAALTSLTQADRQRLQERAKEVLEAIREVRRELEDWDTQYYYDPTMGARRNIAEVYSGYFPFYLDTDVITPGPAFFSHATTEQDRSLTIVHEAFHAYRRATYDADTKGDFYYIYGYTPWGRAYVQR